MKKRIILFMFRDILDWIIIYFIVAIIAMILYILIGYILSIINAKPYYIIFIKWEFIIIFIIYSIRLLIDIWLDYMNYFKHLL
nr:MAG TPA: hypothetical protein [Caudoviricetes sp.]